MTPFMREKMDEVEQEGIEKAKGRETLPNRCRHHGDNDGINDRNGHVREKWE